MLCYMQLGVELLCFILLERTEVAVLDRLLSCFRENRRRLLAFFLFDIKWKEMYLFYMSKTPPQLNEFLLNWPI